MNIKIIKDELSAAPKGARKQIVKRYADLYGVSTDTIYRLIRKQFGPAKVVKRKKIIPQSLIDYMGKLKLQSMSLGNDERELCSEETIQIAIDSDMPGAEGLKVSTVNRRLRECGFRAKERIVRVEASYPNQMHQLDFSRSKYFQVKSFNAKQEDYLLRVSGHVLDYKEDDHKLRTWLCGIIDAYSRVDFTRAIVAGGESVLAGVEFVQEAYGRERDANSIHFMPDILKIDNGSLGKSAPFLDLLEQLQIKRELVIPNKKRGIQKNESHWKTTWQRFELPLAMRLGDGKTIYLQDYNDLLFDFAIRWAEKDHPIKQGSRVHVYLSGLQLHEQREMDADLKSIIARPYKRKVDNTCCVSIAKQKYELSNSEYIDKWINVLINANGEAIGELVDAYSKPFPLKPVRGYVELGDFEGREKQTYRQSLEEQMKGESKKKSKELEVVTEEPGVIKYMEPRIVNVEPDTKFGEVFQSAEYEFANEYDAKRYIGEMIYRDTFRKESYENYQEVFDLVLAESLRKKQIDEIWNEVKPQAMAL